MKFRILKASVVLQLAFIIAVIAGCRSAYYKTMEAFGYHKRDLLVERVQESRDAQEVAKEQFKSALEKFGSVVEYSGGELEEKYKTLSAELDKSEAKAKAVHKRIADVESVADALFDEWKAELSQYSNENLRRSSEDKLKQTRQQYGELIEVMKRAESKIEPVLSVFRDHVLFLKHNLNAQAIASLQDELASVEADVASLVKEMEASIAEADTFIKVMAGK